MSILCRISERSSQWPGQIQKDEQVCHFVFAPAVPAPLAPLMQHGPPYAIRVNPCDSWAMLLLCFLGELLFKDGSPRLRGYVVR